MALYLRVRHANGFGFSRVLIKNGNLLSRRIERALFTGGGKDEKTMKQLDTFCTDKRVKIARCEVAFY